MKLVFLGPPGVGKGTQTEKIALQFNLTVIATGNMIREAIQKKTPLGKKVQTIVFAGSLVDDDLVCAMLFDHIKKNNIQNFLLDGVPRTVKQAEVIEKMGIEKVCLFEADDEVLIERLSGRFTHPASGRVYHKKFNPPKVAGVDDETGESLIQRDDDKQESVINRLKVYHEQTAPLIDYYQNHKTAKLIKIDASQSIEKISKDLGSALST